MTPEFSARFGPTAMQGGTAASLVMGFAISAVLWPAATWAASQLLALAAFTTLAVLRLILLSGSLSRPSPSTSRPPPHGCNDGSLPSYTILVPLLREAKMLPGLVACMKQLDYPADRLDIKLILEADDHETLDAALELDLDERFEIVVVPDCAPRTKPKACNVGLAYARGSLLVVFDAEDRPDRDQLQCAAQRFNRLPADIICLQARLNFYNAPESWLTRQFTIEYAVWFNIILPGLHRLGLPFPLGGTSNHFRTEALRRLGGWDSYNVTEDADLGFRLRRLGYGAATLPSTTYEEANCQLGNWIRQRSRWQKGYLQTWLVHMRASKNSKRRLSLAEFASLQLILGGSILTGLAPIVFLTMSTLAWLGLTPPSQTEQLPVLAQAQWVILFGSFALSAALGTRALYLTQQQSLRPSILLMPVYWACISLGAVRGIWQFVRRPFHWEKTVHGISRWPQDGMAVRDDRTCISRRGGAASVETNRAD